MKVILSKDVAGLGRAGQIKEVSDGHARNFLIPRHLALPATSAALSQIQKEESEHEAKVARLAAQSVELKRKLEAKVFLVSGKAAGERLFAAVKPAQIAQVIQEKLHLAIEPKQVIITTAIKTLGIHDAEIRLTETIHAKVKIEVTKQV